jgi:hypothetical protein
MQEQNYDAVVYDKDELFGDRIGTLEFDSCRGLVYEGLPGRISRLVLLSSPSRSLGTYRRIVLGETLF